MGYMNNIIVLFFLSSMLFSNFVDSDRATDIARNFHNSRSDAYTIESIETIS